MIWKLKPILHRIKNNYIYNRNFALSVSHSSSFSFVYFSSLVLRRQLNSPVAIFIGVKSAPHALQSFVVGPLHVFENKTIENNQKKINNQKYNFYLAWFVALDTLVILFEKVLVTVLAIQANPMVATFASALALLVTGAETWAMTRADLIVASLWTFSALLSGVLDLIYKLYFKFFYFDVFSNIKFDKC